MNDILQYAIQNGIINLRGVAEEVKLKKLESHHIWQGKNGFFYSKVNGRLIKRKQLSDLNQALLDLENKYPLKKVYELYLENKRNISNSTKYRYDTIFKRHLADWQDKDIESITQYDIETFVTNLFREGISGSEFRALRVVINGTFKLARKMKLIDYSISDTLEDMNITSKDFKPKQHRKQVLTNDEYNRITKYLVDNQDMRNLGLLLLLKSGLRIGELVALKPSDLKDGYIDINKTEAHDDNYYITDKTKTEAGTRKVVLPKQDLWILNELKCRRAFNEYVFEFKSYQFRNRLNSVCNKLGIERVSPHKLRKTYASRLFANGVDERIICTQMGHTDIRTTKQYYIKDNTTLEERKAVLSKVT